jgi:hypothetical protein
VASSSTAARRLPDSCRASGAICFFLRDDLFVAAQDSLVAFLAKVEARLLEKIERIAADRVAKESVIQGLLAR